MNHWIVSSKHSRDETTQSWESNKWAADQFLKNKRFYPSKRVNDFGPEDLCILKVFGSQDFIGDFRIASEGKKDEQDHVYYDMDAINEWDFPVRQSTLPKHHTDRLSRNPSTQISEHDFYGLIGIRRFTQNLRLNYKNRLVVPVSERDVENLLDTKNALRSIGLEIVDRQLELVQGNRLDLLCQDADGDLVVVELKKGGANETIGQLARYIADVREHRAKQGQKVRGLVLAFDLDEQLIKAARAVEFEVKLYQLSFA
jgi:hypothetical protein